MKGILKGIGIAVAASVALLYLNGQFRFRISSSTESIGIVEEVLFGRPIEEVFGPPWSEDYKRWDAASKASASVADLLQQFGARDLTLKEELAPQRAQARRLSKLAFEKASAVSRAHLASSNADLPDAYFNHFVPAMESWHRGFADGDLEFVKLGVSEYNAFVVWMQSHDRTEFKRMR